MIACPNLLQRKSLWTNIRYLRQLGKWAEAITFELIDEEAASAGKPYPWPNGTVCLEPALYCHDRLQFTTAS